MKWVKIYSSLTWDQERKLLLNGILFLNLCGINLGSYKEIKSEE
jgi:hypothetical protein